MILSAIKPENRILPVFSFFSFYPPDATPRISHIAGIAWDDMKMKLWHRLAGGFAVVHAQIESLRLRCQSGEQLLLRPVHPVQ